MSNLKPLRSLNAPNAEPFDARQTRRRRTTWIVLGVALALSVLGAAAGVAALTVLTPSGAPRPAAAEALETHFQRAGIDATVTVTRTRGSHAEWQALLYVKSGGTKYVSTLTRYDTEANAVAESRGYCASSWNTCGRQGALVLNVREDSWSKSDPARARMLAAFASFRE